MLTQSKSSSKTLLMGGLLLLAFGFVTTGFTQEKTHSRNGDNIGFPDLVGELKATKGCLGVETAQTTNGKQVIFAWFENKKAVLNWYDSDMHQGVIETFFPNGPSRKALKDVPDGMGPIMVSLDYLQ